MRRKVEFEDGSGTTAEMVRTENPRAALLSLTEGLNGLYFKFDTPNEIREFTAYMMDVADEIDKASAAPEVATTEPVVPTDALDPDVSAQQTNGELLGPVPPRVNGKKSQTYLTGKAKKARDRALALDVLRGWSYQAVAKRYNVGITTVGKILKDEMMALPIDDKPDHWTIGWARKNAERLTEAYLNAGGEA